MTYDKLKATDEVLIQRGANSYKTTVAILGAEIGSSTDLTDYATKVWVQDQGYTTQAWVQSQGYLTSHQSLSGYATQSWVNSQGFAKGSIPTDNSQIGNGRNYITNNISGSFTCSDNLYTGDAIVFTSQSNGALLHSPESSGGLLRWRLAAPETKVFFRNYKTSSWVEVANASDPKLKIINTKAAMTNNGPTVVDRLQVINFQWDEDELKRANLYVNHVPGQPYNGFDANQVEILIPGSTQLNAYLPDENDLCQDDQYRSIEKEGVLTIIAELVREVQDLKLKLNALTNQ